MKGAMRTLARMIRLAAPALSLAFVLALAVGFFHFTARVQALSPPEIPPEADAIVVLTGGTQGRLDTGLDLLRAGAGERLLISGVNPSLSNEDVQEALDISDDLAACCIDFGREAQDTLGNASETADWARTHGYGRLLLVTDDYHMPRSFIELRLAMPDVTLLPYPVESSWAEPTEWSSRPGAVGRMVVEYGKYLIVKLREGVITTVGYDASAQKAKGEDGPA
jgi:uncharacterized SAM-binding protein YcdF (DUF218 family)